jgi:hypothetical protein
MVADAGDAGRAASALESGGPSTIGTAVAEALDARIRVDLDLDLGDLDLGLGFGREFRARARLKLGDAELCAKAGAGLRLGKACHHAHSTAAQVWAA